MGSHVMASRSGVLVPVLIDPQDLDRLGSRKVSIGSHGYAQVSFDRCLTLVHRWVLGLRKGDGLIGDHINGDRLDNRRSNLRIVDASGSSQNVSGRGRSRFRGVYPTRAGRWMAKVKFQGRYHCCGTYETEEQAAAVAEAKRCELMPYYVRR
ncbi:HNH endonuclease [Streptomyces sp. NPDC088178]|uniref:HNH endonuclease n=1 Tax=Streptomyces sp. NPDC088178 TaxID=3365836 RepID=UPI00380EA17C